MAGSVMAEKPKIVPIPQAMHHFTGWVNKRTKKRPPEPPLEATLRLAPHCGGAHIKLPADGSPIVIGRRTLAELAGDARVSREHVRVRATSSKTMSVEMLGVNPAVVRKPRQPAIELLRDGPGYEISVGEEMSLLPPDVEPPHYTYILEDPTKPPPEYKPPVHPDGWTDGPEGYEYTPKRPRVDPVCRLCCGTGYVELEEGKEDCMECTAQGKKPMSLTFEPEADESAKADGAVGEPADSLYAWRLMKVHPRYALSNKNCVSLSDLIVGVPEWVLLIDYMIDLVWLRTALPALEDAGKVMVWGCAKANDLPEYVRTLPHWTFRKLTCPEIYGVHHTKMALVSYREGLRVIVHTANLLYEDNNSKSQGIWWQDFPPRGPTFDPAVSPDQTFGKDLTEYLQVCGWQEADEEVLQKYDFHFAGARFIGTVPGRHKGPALHKWGHMKLRRVLKEEGLTKVTMDDFLLAQCSSMGKVTSAWLEEFRESMAGGVGPVRETALILIWPGSDEIRESLTGYASGQSIPGRKQLVVLNPLRFYYHRWLDTHRAHAAPHLKTYHKYQYSGDVAYSLLTSANLSMAAWGKLQLRGLQLHCYHYEVGVLIIPRLLQRRVYGFDRTTLPGPRFLPPKPVVPFKLSAARSKGAKIDGAAIVPTPYDIPPNAYHREQLPWACDETWDIMDRWGRRKAGGQQYYNYPQD